MKNKNSRYIIWLGLVLVLLVTGAVFATNISGAWMGGSASTVQVIMTVLYTVFWFMFTLVSVKVKPLRRIVFVISLLTMISAAISFICVTANNGFIIEALMSVFVSIPFYGFRIFTSWEGWYGGAFVVSLVWFSFAVWQLRKGK